MLSDLPQILIGRRVRAQIKIGDRPAMIVPRPYVSTRFGVDYVRLVRPDGAISQTPVQTAGAATADAVEVLSGIRAGDVLSPFQAGRSGASR